MMMLAITDAEGHTAVFSIDLAACLTEVDKCVHGITKSCKTGPNDWSYRCCNSSDNDNDHKQQD